MLHIKSYNIMIEVSVWLNPENGICLSSLYDKAFDKGLIGLNLDYTIIVSDKLKQNTAKPYYQQYFSHLEKKSIY